MKQTEEAVGIIERLLALDPSRPVVDKERVERALAEYLCALGQEPLPVHWACDAIDGYLAAYRVAKPAAIEAAGAVDIAAIEAQLVAEGATKRAAARAAKHEAELMAWEAAQKAAESAVRSAAERTADRVEWDAACAWLSFGESPKHVSLRWCYSEAAHGIHQSIDRAGLYAVEDRLRRIAQRAADRVVWSAYDQEQIAGPAVDRAPRDMEFGARWLTTSAERWGWPDNMPAADRVAWSVVKDALHLATARARRAAVWVAVRPLAKQLVREGEAETLADRFAETLADRFARIWLPFVEACEAGLWLYWITQSEVIAVPRPVLRYEGTTLHCDYGPAVWWPGGTQRHWCLNGVEVTQGIVETPAAALDPRLLYKERNAEVRREIVRKIGIERVCEALHATVVDQRDGYQLLLLELGDGRSRPYLKMRNPSTGAYHIEGVRPGCRTVQEALNYRNNLSPDMIDDVEGEDWYQQGDVILKPRGAVKLKSRPVVLT